MWDYIGARQTLIKRNRVDLYHFGYMLLSKSARHLGETTTHLIKNYTTELRGYLVKEHRALLSESFMNKAKRTAVETVIKNYLLNNQIVVPDVPSYQLLNIICNDIVGFGIIQSLIDDEDVTDIYINGTKEIRYEKIGEGECVFDYRFDSEEEIKSVAYKIVNSTSESLNTAKPYVDCVFPYIRFNIALDEIAGLGTTITIRKNANHLRASEERMLSTNQATKEMLDFISAAVKAKMNILVAGAVGTGKTEFIKYAASHIPENERTLVVEDHPELYLQRVFPDHHFVPMQCRSSEVEANAVDFDRLLTNALRQGMKRLIVGESRGKEALQMVNFFQTGHPGSTSIHCRSAEESFKRLMLMCLQSGTRMDANEIYDLLAQTFDLVIFLEKKEDYERYVTQMVEVGDYIDGKIQFNHLSQFHKTHEERNADGKLVKIHGKHVTESKVSKAMVKKFKESTVDEVLYRHYLPEEDIKHA